MPFLSIKVTPKAQLVQKRFERLRRKIPLISRKRLYDAAVAIRSEMKKPGEAVKYPIKWDSPKQRRAFFATDGFGGGIPHKRTGDYQRAWKVIPVQGSPADVGYDVGNPLVHSKYISGTARSVRRQSRIHRGRWNLFKVVKDKVISALPKKVRESLQQIARQEGFRSK